MSAEALNKKYEGVEEIQNFINQYESLNGKDSCKKLERSVGSNGIPVGKTFTLTGVLKTCEVKDENGKVTAVYLGLECDDHETFLSLKSLMGISSLQGYNLTEELTEEYDEEGKKKERTYKSDVRKDITTENYNDIAWMPPTRNLLDMAKQILDNTYSVEGKTVTFLGTACKQWTAKKAPDAKYTFMDKYKKDYLRVTRTKLWAMN